MKIKNNISLFLSLCMMFTSFSILPVSAEPSATEETYVAEANFATGQRKGIEKIALKDNTSPDTVSRKGTKAWLMDSSNSAINIILEDSFKSKKNDGSVYTVEVDYYDSGNGWFRMYYDSLTLDKMDGGTLYTSAKDMWETATFVIDDAEFNEGVDKKYDISLSLQAYVNLKTQTSSTPIAVKAIRITREAAKNPVYVTSTTNKTGHTYRWFDKEKLVSNTFSNLTDKELEVDVTYRLVNPEGREFFSKTEKMSFLPKEVKESTLDIGEVEHCDIYTYEVSVDGEEISSTRKPLQISVIKTDPDGIRNEGLYFAEHINGLAEERMLQGLEMLSLGNVYGTRGTIYGFRARIEKDTYNWNIHTSKPFLDKVKEYGMEYIAILFGSLGDYYGMSLTDMPSTDEELEGWRIYISSIAEFLKNYTNSYEIWNEPNIQHFNPRFFDNVDGNGGEAADYAKLYNIAYEEIKKINPDAKVAGPSLANVGGGDAEEYFAGALEAGLNTKIDAFALHPYTYNGASLEKASKLSAVQWYRDELAKYNANVHPEIWHTETGYTLPDKLIGKRPEIQGAYNSRAALTYKAYDLGDKIVLYNYDKKGTIMTDRESQFGHVTGGNEAQEMYGTYFVPTRSYLMIAGMNYIMAETEADGIYNSKDENVRVYKFRSSKFNKDILSLFRVDRDEDVTLKLGADKVTCYDSMGNPTEIVGKGGIFTFTAEEAPKYIVGDIQMVEYVDNPIVELDKISVQSVKGDDITIKVKNNSGKKIKTQIIAPMEIEILSEGDFGSQSKDSSIKVRNNRDTGNRSILEIMFLDEADNVIQQSFINFITEELISASLMTELASKGGKEIWYGYLDITNHSESKIIKGSANFLSPDFLKATGNVKISEIPKGCTRRFKFRLPEITRKQQYKVEYNLTFESGETFTELADLTFTVATYAKTKPVIDGILSPNEWNYEMSMYADSADNIKNIKGWRGIGDLSGKSSVMWDEENMYMYAEVTDDVFNCSYPPGSLWQGDSMQFGVFYGEENYVAIGQAATSFHEIGIANTLDGEVAYRYSAQDGSWPTGVMDGAEVAVVRQGNKTIYEFSVPWKKLLREEDEIKENSMLGYSFLFNDNDGSGRRGWIEYAGGIGSGKDTTLFTYMKLIK